MSHTTGKGPHQMVHQAYLDQVHERIATLTRERDEAIRERERYRAWLSHIDGGSAPCTNEAQLRQWAYEAVTLGHPAPGTEES